MRYAESLIVGFLIGCIALLAQVGTSVFCEIFLTTPFPLHYTATMSPSTLFFVMGIIATIEEVVRFFCIFKKFTLQPHLLLPNTILPHGILLGGGFALCEMFLSLSSWTHTHLSLLLLLWPLSVHIFASTTFLYATYAYRKKKIALILLVISMILFHLLVNALIFFTYN